MEIRTAQLHPDQCFHIFNRGVNGQTTFFEEKNYDYFLKKYGQYVHPFVETFAYCLLKNHFHLMIKVRSEGTIREIITTNHEKPTYWHVSNGLSSFIQSYTRAINKMYNRTGAIFETPFKRIEVESESYFTTLISYIHHNPEKHQVISDFKRYPHSSYQAHLSGRESKLNRQEVLDWFGGEKAYEEFHELNSSRIINRKLLLE